MCLYARLHVFECAYVFGDTHLLLKSYYIPGEHTRPLCSVSSSYRSTVNPDTQGYMGVCVCAGGRGICGCVCVVLLMVFVLLLICVLDFLILTPSGLGRWGTVCYMIQGSFAKKGSVQ